MTDDGYIFISYSRTDGVAHAEQLEKTLRQAGHKTWRDVTDLDPARDFTAGIERAIQRAHLMVVCVTPDSIREDSFVREEIQYARALKKPVIVLRFDDLQPQLGIQNNEWIDFFAGWDSAFARLMKVLNFDYSGSGGGTLPLRDPFHRYLRQMQQLVKQFSGRALAEELTLMADETAGAVESDEDVSDLLDQLFIDTGSSKAGEEIVFHSFEEAFAYHDESLLLLGEPGAGKTTTLLLFLRTLVQRRMRDPHAPLPLLGIIRTWDSNSRPSLHGWLSGLYDSLRHDLIRQEIEAGRVILILDGLDELGSQRDIWRPKRDEKGDEIIDPNTGEKVRVLERIDPRRQFMQMIHDEHRVVMSCRVRDYEEIGYKLPMRGAVTLRPLSDAQIDAYLRDQPELKAALDRDEELRDMVRRPLVLWLFASTFKDLGAETEHLHQLDGGDLRDAMFATYVQRRLAMEWNKIPPQDRHKQKYPPERITTVLGRMAMDNAAGESVGAVNWAENLISRHDFRRILEDFDANDFIDHCVKLNLFTVVERGSVRFIHRMLRDYFAFAYAREHLDDPALYTDRRNPAAALAALGDIRAIPPLRALLEVHDRRMREAAAHALGAIGDLSARSALNRAIHDPDIEVGRAAVTALGGLGPEALPSLLDIRRRPDIRAELRQIAADVILKTRDRAAVPYLVDALSDASSNNRWVAARTLGYIGDPDAVTGLLHAMRDGDTRVRGEAANALAGLGRSAVPSLLETLKDADPGIRELTAQALAKTGWEPDTNEQGARYYVALGQWNSVVAYGGFAVSYLLDALRHPATRNGAAGALGRIGGTALSGLIDALQDPDPEVRRTATGILTRLKRPEAVPALIATLQNDTEPYVRVGAVRALAAIQDEAAVPVLVKSLADTAATSGKNNRRVCDAAADALEKINTPAAKDALRRWREH